MSAANELTAAVIDHIYRAGGYGWRAASVGIYDTSKQSFRTSAKKGVADVLSVYKGRLIAVEIKIGKDRLSDEQQGFLENVRHCGGVGIVARNFNQFKEEWSAAVADMV